MPAPIYLTTEEVAAVLKIKQRTVQLKIRTGQLPALNLGSDAKPSYRVDPAELDRYIAAKTAA